MTNKKIKKYVLPNLPYLFVFWFFCKIGEAYRLSEGTDIIRKVMGIMTALSKAMSNPLPSFNPYDLLIGVAGAGGIFVVVYFKKKNAKKFRRNVEYGSARWSA